MVFKKEPSIENFVLFGSGSKDPFVKQFLKDCETKANGKELTRQELEVLVCKHEFDFDWYKNKNYSGNVEKTLTKLPIKWTDEFRAHMNSPNANKPEYAMLQDWMITRMKAGKSTKLTDFYTLHPDAKKGAKISAAPAEPNPKKVSGGSKAPAKAEAGPAPAKAGPSEDAGKAVQKLERSFGVAVLERLKPPVDLFFVRNENGIKFYLAIPQAKAEDLKQNMGETHGEFTEFLEWYTNEEKQCADDAANEDEDDDQADKDDEDEDQADNETDTKQFFTNTFGYENFKKCKVPYLPDQYPKQGDVHRDLYPYVVTPETIKTYSEVAANQYKDSGKEGMANTLTEATQKFLDHAMQSKYITYKEQERIEEENKAKARALAAEKAEFARTFYEKTTQDEIDKRHAVYTKLHEAKVFSQQTYHNWLLTQIKDIKDKAGVEGDDLDMRVISRDDMKAKLSPFTAIYPGFDDATVEAYLSLRDENIQLCKQAGSLAFNRQFEQDHNGETLKDHIEQSEAPGIWRRFSGYYENYITAKKELDDAAAELNKQLEAAKADNARKRARSASKSPSPGEGAGSIPPSGHVSPRASGPGFSASSSDFSAPKPKSRRSSVGLGVDQSNMIDGRRHRTPPTNYHAGYATRFGSPPARK